MSNSFLTVTEIAERSLPFLEANLTFAGAVNRDFDNSYAKKGDTVQVRKPEIFEATEFVESTGVTFSEVDEESTNVSLDKILTVNKKVGSKQLTMNVNDFELEYILPAMKGLAQKVDVELASLYKDIPYSFGSASTTPNEVSDITGCLGILNANKAPQSPRSLIIDPEAHVAFLGLSAFADISRSNDPLVMREGSMGYKYGFEMSMNQNIQTHTKGTLAGSPVTTASAGATTIAVTAATGSTTVIKGDLIVIDSNQYVVTASVDLSAAGAGNIGIYPALAGDVTAEAITIIGSGVNNLAFHKDAFTLVNRPLEPAMGGAESAVINMNGLSVRVTYGYDMTYKRNMLSWDILTGFKTLYPELAVRLLG